MWKKNAGRSAALAGIVLAIVASAWAETDETLLLGPWKKDQVLSSNTDLVLLNQSHFDAMHTRSNFYEIESTGRFRLDTSRELNPTLGYDWTHIETNGQSQPIPAKLDDMSLALATPLAQVGDWFLGATVGIGYAGSAAFGDSEGWYGKGNVMTGTQLNKDSSLVLLVDYDGNRTWLPDVPLPGFMYASKWGDTLHYALGFPVNAVEWTPIDRLKLSLSTYLLTSIDAAAEYELSHEWTLFAKYATRQDSFYDSRLPENRRLFYGENRVEGGIGYELGESVKLEVGIGYAFGRAFSTGFDERDLQRVTTISDEPYARLGITIRY